jgi:hypothetical protein
MCPCFYNHNPAKHHENLTAEFCNTRQKWNHFLLEVYIISSCQNELIRKKFDGLVRIYMTNGHNIRCWFKVTSTNHLFILHGFILSTWFSFVHLKIFTAILCNLLKFISYSLGVCGNYTCVRWSANMKLCGKSFQNLTHFFIID